MSNMNIKLVLRKEEVHVSNRVTTVKLYYMLRDACHKLIVYDTFSVEAFSTCKEDDTFNPRKGYRIAKAKAEYKAYDKMVEFTKQRYLYLKESAEAFWISCKKLSKARKDTRDYLDIIM